MRKFGRFIALLLIASVAALADGCAPLRSFIAGCHKPDAPKQKQSAPKDKSDKDSRDKLPQVPAE